MSKIIGRALKKDDFVEMPDDHIIICRCEEITKGEIRRAIYEGMYTMNEIKRYLRVGMGLCQGQTCNKLVKAIVAKELGLDMKDIEIPIPRSPARPIAMKAYADDGYMR
ncbi:UNVERIFIED_CONTAM: NAD(P)H-nitrite reductase [Acetivibrio alkalicellulosi]